MKTAQSRRIQRAVIAPMIWIVAMMAFYWYTAIFMSNGPAYTAHGAQEAIRQTEALKQNAKVKIAVLVGEVVVMCAGTVFLGLWARRKRGLVP